ncbi:MAC/Perforin domain [Sparganum proliferum]
MQQRNFTYPAITSVIWLSLIFVCQSTVLPKSPSARTVDVIEIEQPHQLRSVQCELKPGQQLLSVLPGSGWDNLVNEERGLTTDRETYTLCRISSDGKLLLPDDVFVENLKSSRIELTSDVFSHFTNYTSLTSYSMNTGTDIKMSFASVSGDFSFEKEYVRKTENANRGLIVRSQLRHRIYAVHQLPDSNLHPRFRNRLLDIAAHLEASNSTEQSNRSNTARDVVMQTGRHFGALVDNIRAAYLADLIVRDYGTHTVMSVEAGAVIAKVDSLSSSSRLLSASDRLKLKSSASSSFMEFFRISAGTSTSNVDQSVEKYNSMVSASTVISHGGMHLKASDLNISVWEDTIGSNLVAIDRRGRLIYDLITPRTLPELTETMALRLAGVIKAAVERYYAANTVVGCLDPTSTAYDMDANVPADQCDDPLGNGDDHSAEGKPLPLGGVYETCSGPKDLCAGRASLNPATGKAACPYGYMAVQLLQSQVRACRNKCSQNSFWVPDCTQECAVTTAFWCAIDPQLQNSTEGSNTGFLFGGIYTDTTTNPMTHAMSCPLYYDAYPLGRRLRVCLSSDREMGRRYSLPFGGFYACQSDNPLVDVLCNDAGPSLRALRRQKLLAMGSQMLATDSPGLFQASWAKRCPTGYTSHLAVIEDICQVNYCTPANSIKVVQERRLQRPPFIQLPELAAHNADPAVEKIVNGPKFFRSASGHHYQNVNGEWMRAPVPTPTPFSDGWAVASLVLAGCLCIFLLAALFVWRLRRRGVVRRAPVRSITSTA